MSADIKAIQMNMIGEQIKKYRTKIKMSQQDLSEALEDLGVYTCRCSISRIESGKRAITDIEVDAFSKVLKVSLDQLFNR